MINITLEEAKNYLRVDFNEDDTFITNIIAVAKSYVLNYTGLTEEEANSIEELRVCELMLMCEMYDKREISTSNDINIAPIFKMLLDAHCKNFM